MEVSSGNLFANLARPAANESFEPMFSGTDFRVERIVSHGHATPVGQWYDQPEEEWVVLLAGSASLLLEGEAQPRNLRPGDWIHLPAHVRHRVEQTDSAQPTVWLAMHYIATAAS